MNRPIENSSFQPKHGGGGSMFYMGRQDQSDDQDEQEKDEKEKDKDKDKDKEGDGPALSGDRVELQSGRSSSLNLAPYKAVENWDALSDELKNNLRYLTLAVSHLERDFARRQHVEIGDVVIEP